MALPNLLDISAYGDFSDYQNAVYACFCASFCGKPSPLFCGRKLVFSRDKIEGKCSRFWHIVTAGKVENERQADLDRYARIAWIRPMIDYRLSGEFAYWRFEKRLIVATRDFGYLVVMQEAKNVVILVTAYCKHQKNAREQLERQYNSVLAKDRLA
jgi:hypothetical protein